MDRDLLIQLLNALIEQAGGKMYGLPFNIPGSQFTMPNLNPQLPIIPQPIPIPERVDTPPAAFPQRQENAGQPNLVAPNRNDAVVRQDLPRRRPQWEVDPSQTYWPPEVLAKLMSVNPVDAPKVGGIFPLKGF